ncbi:MAG: hypothetical protein MJE77_15280 [Proteobacteria bacterium]|nr:hypothetical protein [Pseudomonadota bacterium]
MLTPRNLGLSAALLALCATAGVAGADRPNDRAAANRYHYVDDRDHYVDEKDYYREPGLSPYHSYDPVRARATVERRIARQKHRIRDGKRVGDLTRSELRWLRWNHRRIKSRLARYTYDGYLSPREHAKMIKLLNRASAQIRQARQNHKRRYYDDDYRRVPDFRIQTSFAH